MRLARAAAFAENGEIELARREIEAVLADDPQYTPALTLLDRLSGAAASAGSVRAAAPTTAESYTSAESAQRQPAHNAATGPDMAVGAELAPHHTETGVAVPATLPGTNVSTGSWAQFQRRMKLRRESTCVAAMRRAMEAGDYALALERANELAGLDTGWNEVKSFLEQVQAERKSAARVRPAAGPVVAPPAVRPSEPRMAVRTEPAPNGAAAGRRVPPAAETGRPRTLRAPALDVSKSPAVRNKVTAAAVVTAPPRRRPLRAAALVVVVLLACAGLAGWSLVWMFPDSTFAREIASLLGTNAASQAQPSPVAPTTEAVNPPTGADELAPLPFVGTTPTPTAPRSPAQTENGNPVSPDRKQADQSASASPKLGTPGSSAVTTRPDARAAESETAANNARALAEAAPPTRQLGTAPALPGISPPLTPPQPNTSGDIVNPPAGTGTSSSSSGDNRVVPPLEPQSTSVPPLPVSPPSQTSAASPPAGTTRPAGEDTAAGGRVSTLGSAPAPVSRSTSGLAAADRQADERAIRQTLSAYVQGYVTLNAGAVKRIWPNVNEEALANAFEQLESQRIAFSGCTIDVSELHASASCRGTASYVPRVGNGTRVTAPRVWRFSLRKVVNNWLIEGAAIQ